MIVFDNEQLVPVAWRHLLSGGPVRIFNPGLLRDGIGWILAYRVVFETDGFRRMAMCRLDDEFAPIASSLRPYSDDIVFEQPNQLAEQALTWFADPRLYRFGTRTYVYWNSGWHEPRNYQFLQEFDSRSLRPLSAPRELELGHAHRQRLEKNWALFESNGAVYAIYSVTPHRVLAVDLSGSGPILCGSIGNIQPNSGGFAHVHGGLRGGAPPHIFDERFWSFCHAIEDAPGGYRYVAAVYQFLAAPPFSALAMPRQPLRLAVPNEARRRHAKLNPVVGEVIYPAGAARTKDQWILSIGIDDERCGLVFLTDDEIQQTQVPVPSAT